MAKEYISYQHFIKKISQNRKEKTKIRYKDKEYMFWYEKGKYCFKQYLPSNSNIQKFNMYEEMLNKIKIEEKRISEIWDSNELQYIYQPIKRGYQKGGKDHEFQDIIILKNRNIYNNVIGDVIKKDIVEKKENFYFNKPLMLNVWDVIIFGWVMLPILVFGIITILPIDEITITQAAFETARGGLICSQLIAFILVGFFVPLLNDAPNKISGYYKSNFPIYGLSLASIIGASINAGMNIGISEGIKTFFVFILGDIAALIMGHIIYKLYYNQKLKEAEKIREEYRKEQEGESYN